MASTGRRLSDRKAIHVDFRLEGGYVEINMSLRHRLPIVLIGLFLSSLITGLLSLLSRLG